jgi:hypothetical protein
VYLGSEWNASNLEELQKNGLVYAWQYGRSIVGFHSSEY